MFTGGTIWVLTHGQPTVSPPLFSDTFLQGFRNKPGVIDAIAQQRTDARKYGYIKYAGLDFEGGGVGEGGRTVRLWVKKRTR